MSTRSQREPYPSIVPLGCDLQQDSSSSYTPPNASSTSNEQSSLRQSSSSSKGKRTNSRKQPVGHIPRPKNAFILFRCDFVREQKIPETVERNHRNISRIVGNVWRQMSAEEKAPWVQRADEERLSHLLAYPNYRYSPVADSNTSRNGGPERKRKVRTIDPKPAGQTPDFSLPAAVVNIPRRASSCPPPGSIPVMVDLDSPCELDLLETPLSTRDDQSRRPSRTAMFKSESLDYMLPAQLSPTHHLYPSMFTFPWSIGPRCPPLSRFDPRKSFLDLFVGDGETFYPPIVEGESSDSPQTPLSDSLVDYDVRSLPLWYHRSN